MYKQIIIARKDLNMSAGKLAAQVSHASMAFLTHCMIEAKKNLQYYQENHIGYNVLDKYYFMPYCMDKDIYDNWIDGEFTKVVLQAKNKNNLMKAVELAKELGMEEGKEYFIIRDNCHTELTPEDDGRTLTCIGFLPMDSEIIDKIGRKYHTYIG